ncbi:MAG: hypothetical protein IJX67_05970 [Oscillospiraceae bacterium]|nr:hypothetical protein [Oscillospiraceae bacterium]
MANQYITLKEKQQQEINDFPMFFAFSQKQFEEGMEKLGLAPEDTDKIYKLGHTGGFYRKTDAQALHELFDRHAKEKAEAIAADTTGEGYIYDMFNYELANHEYGYTRDLEPTLDALGLTVEEINADERLLRGLQKARKEQIAWFNEHW